MNELRKEYHNKTAGQIGEKARDLQTSYFTDEYVFWLEDQLKQLRIASVVKSLKDKVVPTFEEWKKANYIHYDKGLFTRKAEGLKDLDQLIKIYDKEILNL
jgi:hypothetical protein